MIITLKGADFSADNIGQVELERVLNPYTVAAIEASGNTGLTDTQKFALDDLFLAMGVDGSNNVMSKIRKMYIPMLATDVADALINYADNTFPADVTPNSENWELRNNGIAQKASGQNLSAVLSNPLYADNFTQMWLRTENMAYDVADPCASLILRGLTNTGKYLGVKEDSVSSNHMIQWGSYGYTNFAAYGKQNEQRVCVGFTVRGVSDVDAQVYVGDPVTLTVTNSTNALLSGETSETLYLLGFNSQLAPKPFGFMLIGEAITNAQFLAIRDKVNALYSAMKG